jgi:hypothetical protein
MGLPPSDFGGVKLTVASPLPAIAVTLVGGLGMSMSMVVTPKPPPPGPALNAQDTPAVSRTAKIAVIIPLPAIELPPVPYVGFGFSLHIRLLTRNP